MNNKTALDTQKKKGKVVKLIFSILLWVVLGLFFLFILTSFIDRSTGYSFPFLGLRSSVILTPSMSKDISGTNQNWDIKQLQENDMVITFQVNYNDVKIGDVITYNSKAGLICHRVVEKYQSENYQYLVTKGDANDISDAPIEFSYFKGKVIGVVPGIGVVVKFIQSYYFLMAIGFSGFVVFGVVFVYKLTEKNKQQKKEPEAAKIETKPSDKKE